jgi:hypothetical protein
LLSSVRKPLHRSARDAGDDDPTATDAHSGADRRQEEGETALAERPFERGRDADVVPHSDSSREFNVSSSSTRVTMQRLRFGETEQSGHALDRDATFHAAVPTLHHHVAQSNPPIKPFAATNL